MNSITRLILRRVASGNVRLTPQVIEVLREVSTDQPAPEKSEPGDDQPEAAPDESARKQSDAGRHLTFLNPLPGRWIRRTECGLGGALLLVANLAHAAFDPATWKTANNAFAWGNYAEAARVYESIIAHQGYSAPVLFNLANAQQRNGQLGQAILNYERATLLTPNDPDIAANLSSARHEAGIEPERQSPVQKAARTLTMNSWFALASGAGFLLAVALPLKHLRPQARRGLNFGSALAALALFVAVTALVVRGADFSRAVVTASAAIAGISPVSMAQPVFKLRAGDIVTLQQTHGEFVFIRNQTGHAGWVKLAEIDRITPASGTLGGG